MLKLLCIHNPWSKAVTADDVAGVCNIFMTCISGPLESQLETCFTTSRTEIRKSFLGARGTNHLNSIIERMDDDLESKYFEYLQHCVIMLAVYGFNMQEL